MAIDTQAERTDAKEAKAEAKAAKARAKALRPWFKKKRFIIPILLVVLAVLSSLAGGGGDEGSSREAADLEPTAAAGEPTETGSDQGSAPQSEADRTDTRNNDLYPDRVDKQKDDHEAAVGQSVRLSGYTATVESAEPYEVFGESHLLVHVKIENRDDAAQPYNLFDWRIQTPNGQVLDPTFTDRNDGLGSGDLIEGGVVTGVVPFEVGPGTYYVIYKPDPFGAARGIWQVTL